MEYNELFREDDTIAAIATPPGSGGIGIVKISGKAAPGIMKRLFRPTSNLSTPFTPRHLYHGWLIDPESAEKVDEILAVWMKAPSSYTCEDVVEFQCHSGPALLNRIIQLCIDSGARLAEPGEFTRRAFLNGRIDLIQAEAIEELTAARSFTSGRLAMNMLQGKLKTEIEEIQGLLLNILASIEVSIDYPDESEEIMDDLRRSGNGLQEAMNRLRIFSSEFKRSRIYRDGVTVVIAGRPNAGKSSLLNAMAREDRAIVTAIPGTTRDSVDVEITIAGMLIRLIDTAGIRSNPDEVEEIGISRVEKLLREAAVVLWVLDCSSKPDMEDIKAGETIKKAQAIDRTILVLNKVDLVSDKKTAEEMTKHLSCHHDLLTDNTPTVHVSALNGTGLSGLTEEITNRILGKNQEPPEIAPNMRQMEAVSKALTALETANSVLTSGISPEIAAIDIRNACNILGGIKGEDITGDLLDNIFTSFCLGK